MYLEEKDTTIIDTQHSATAHVGLNAHTETQTATIDGVIFPHDHLAQKITETVIDDQTLEELEGIKEEKEEKEDESYMRSLLEVARERKASREQTEKERHEILEALKKLKKGE